MRQKLKSPLPEFKTGKKNSKQEMLNVYEISNSRRAHKDTTGNIMDTTDESPDVPELKGCKIWLHLLYEMWEPQLCDSYRPSASGVEYENSYRSDSDKGKSAKRRGSKKDSLSVKMSKFRAVETVVAAVNHLHNKVREKNKVSSGRDRHSSTGSLPSNNSRRLSVKRSVSLTTY